MTKKHFIELADWLRKPGMVPAAVNRAVCRATFQPISNQLHDAIVKEVLSAVTDELADFCLAQNANFDRQRWLDYIAGKCGPNGGPVK